MGLHILNDGKKARTPNIFFERKIQCPANYLLNPKCDIWVRELVPELKNVSKYAQDRYGVKKYRIKRDRWGFKVMDRKKMREYEKMGLLIKPLITASEAIEKVYDPLSPICIHYCKRACMRGKGNINENTIRRLKGIPSKLPKAG